MRWFFITLTIGIVSLTFGCNQDRPTSTAASHLQKEFLLAEEPSGAQGVTELKQVAADGEKIVVEGRIGGDTQPFVSGQAAFVVVDTSLKPCNEKDDDSCATPWDYCCDLDLLPASRAMVKLVDEHGNTIAADAREILDVKELQTVVVRGHAKRDEAGNLTVLASGVFVRN